MNKHLLLVSLLAALLTACVTTGKRGGDTPMVAYDFGLPSQRLAPGTAIIPLALEVRAPYWFDSLGVEYRLLYAEPARLRDYAMARWAGPPSTLMQQRLIQQLGVIPHGQGGARCLLRIDIEEFSQWFDTPQASRGVLRGLAVVLDSRRDRIAERQLAIETKAPTPDSAGGVAALAAAVDQMAGELAAWQGGLLAQPRFKGCQR